MMKRNKQYRQELRRELLAQVDAGGVPPGQAVRTYREILGMTQEAFAVFQGVSFNAVKQVENQRGNPTFNLIAKMLRGSGLELCVGRLRKT